MQTTKAMRSDWASATLRSSAPSAPEIITTAVSPPGNLSNVFAEYTPSTRRGLDVACSAPMKKRSDAAGRWREILRKQRASGLSVAAFCRRSRITQTSFYAWRRKLRDVATFTEVRVTSESALTGDALPVARSLEVVLTGGRSIAVRPGFDRATLLALVDALERGTADADGEESGA